MIDKVISLLQVVGVRISLGLILSGVLHGATFFGAGFFIIHSAEFGIEVGEGGGPVLEEEIEIEVEYEEPEPEVIIIEEEAEEEVEEVIPPEPKPKPKPKKKVKKTYRGSGAKTRAKPQHFRNPPPPYPESARRRGIEGTTRVFVVVNANGTVNRVKLSRSSGNRALDRAALKAVKRYKFYPASVGGVKIRSTLVVPVRFTLN